MRKELGKYGMQVLELKKAYFMAPIIETYLPFIPLRSISKADNKVAGVLPPALASGWYFRIGFTK
jgi:hypothetical protein